MFLVIVLPELRRSTTFAFLKNTVKIGDIIESAMIAYLDNCHGAIGKQTGCMTKTNIDDIF